MDYKEKYEKALCKAKKYHQQLLDEDNPEWASEIAEIFPELKEAKDEKIRKSILELVRQSSEVLDKNNQTMINKIIKEVADLVKLRTDFSAKEVADLVSENIIFSKKEVLTSDEAARYLGISKSYLHKLTMKKEIPHFKPLGKMCYFNRQELEALLQSNRVAMDVKHLTK